MCNSCHIITHIYHETLNCLLCRDEKMQVLDYCPKNLLDLSAVELSSSTSALGMGALISSVSGSGVAGVKSAAWLTLIQNSGKKTCEMIILFDGPKERTAWLELIQPSQVRCTGESRHGM